MALVTPEDAKAQFDILTSESDEQLQKYIDALTPVIEHHVGPVEQREFTETIEGRGPTMCLSHIPAVALVKVTPALPSGPDLDLSSLFLDTSKGIVHRQSGTFTRTLWSVTYTAGREEVPPTIRLAALLLLQHLWRTKNGPARGRGTADDFDVSEQLMGYGYAVPNRVLHLLEPYKLPPGVA
ncbi:hypothetical protein [Streptomyces sp. sk226]|uniref:hypothetical protein n=1 Tax=Streptomyces sp. sk226 TaxID=2034268 RepID=UPI000BF03958|nr:hypothetical protein [Streptomyces sp. sk226]